MNVRVPAPWLDINIVIDVISKDDYGLRQLAEAGRVDTILDVGGHIGSFGMLAKSLWPKARLIAIEPHPDNCKLYRKNLRDNGLHHNSSVMQAALGYDKASKCLLNSPSTTGGHVMRTRAEADKYINEGYRFYNRVLDDNVRIVTIEEIIKNFNLDIIELAKFDCEGGEVDVFKNITPEAAAKFRIMVGEYHIWDEHGRYLKPDVVDCMTFWRQVKKNFPHLNFDYRDNALGLFQAWPKKGAA